MVSTADTRLAFGQELCAGGRLTSGHSGTDQLGACREATAGIRQRPQNHGWLDPTHC